jgi:hypothetical protein
MSLVTERARRNVSAIFAAAVNERRLAGLTHNLRPMIPALQTRRRFRLNAGRLLRTEHVFAGITAVVDGWWNAETPRPMAAALRTDVRRRRSLHERLETARFVPTMAAQIPYCLLPSRFCVVHFRAFLKRKRQRSSRWQREGYPHWRSS